MPADTNLSGFEERLTEVVLQLALSLSSLSLPLSS